MCRGPENAVRNALLWTEILLTSLSGALVVYKPEDMEANSTVIALYDLGSTGIALYGAEAGGAAGGWGADLGRGPGRADFLR